MRQRRACYDFSMATNNELKAILDERGVKYAANANKDELEKLVKDSEPDETEEGNQSEEDSEEQEEGSGDEEGPEDGADEGEDLESDVDTADASGDVTKYGVYKGAACVAVFNVVNHGDDFIKIAKAKAKAIGGVARPYVDPKEPEPEKDVVNIVNRNGNLVRQFALSTHGKEYAKLAEDFVAKYGEKKGLHIQE